MPSTVRDGSFFDKLSFIVLFLTVLLLPLLFIPSNVYPFQLGKILLLTVGTLLALILWIAGRLKEGRLSVPFTPIFIAAGLILFEFFLSSLFSSSIQASLVGQGFEVGTFGFLLVGFVLFFLVAVHFSSKKRAFYAYFSFLIVFVLIGLFHALRLAFGPTFLSMGLFTDQTANIIGKWNDFGIFIGVATTLTMVTLDLLSVKSLWRIVLWLVLLLSVALLAVVNFSVLWIVLGAFSLVFAFYLVSIGYKKMTVGSVNEETHTSSIETSGRRKIPYASVVVLAISLIFIFGGQNIGEKISTRFQIFQIETRPSWSSTLDTATVALKQDPLFGVGPNRFVNTWLLNKPAPVNQTVFWNTDFNYGIGLIPTFVVTTGILGLILWIIFVLLYILLGFKALLSSNQDHFSRYLSISSFIVSVFLWVFSIVYIPTATVLSLTFFWSGLFIASVYRDRIIQGKTLLFANRPKLGFISIVCLIVLLVASIAVGYTVINKFNSSLYLAKALRSFNQTGNIEATENYLNKAQAAAESDTGYRFLSELSLVKINNLLSGKSDLTQDALRTKFQSLLGDALRNADAARNFDRQNYQNWVTLGRVYEAVVPLNIEGAHTNALNAYNEALKVNPHNPELYLVLARLEVANKNNKKAHEYINLALKEKSNYTEAIFFLSQLQVQEGDLKSAIESVGSASILAPNDPVVQFQLGLLKYNVKDYKGAVEALSRAVALNTVYANAKYFLGLSLYQIGRTQDAIAQFESIKGTNPDNQEVLLILSNLKAGRAPFSNAKPPVDDKPEKRATLPVKEKTATPSQ